VTVAVSIPGVGDLLLEHLILDMNGTLTNRGVLLEGVEAKLVRVSVALDIRLVSADTFGTLDAIAKRLKVGAVRASSGKDKVRVLDELGREQSAVIGNGANDVPALAAAALGIAVLGPEGASGAALRSADVVCASVVDALDLLLDPKALTATLRT
jgi:soluble P-type ATPase